MHPKSPVRFPLLCMEITLIQWCFFRTINTQWHGTKNSGNTRQDEYSNWLQITPELHKRIIHNCKHFSVSGTFRTGQWSWALLFTYIKSSPANNTIIQSIHLHHFILNYQRDITNLIIKPLQCSYVTTIVLRPFG